MLARELRAISDELRSGEAFLAPDRADRLALVRRLAAEVLSTRPSSWEAAMLLGEARFLESWLGGDALLDRTSWEAPLELAHELSPGQSEPLVLLGGAYIRLWPELRESDRERALVVLERAFLRFHNLRALLDEWLEQEPSIEQVLRAVPPETRSLRQVEGRFRKAADHAGVAAVVERTAAVRKREFQDSLDRASRRVRLRAGPRGVQNVLAGLRTGDPTAPDLPSAALLDRALRIGGRTGLLRNFAADARAWIDWAVERCLLASCPLSSEALRVLAGAIPAGDVLGRTSALLAAGELRDAERLRLRADSDSDGDDWGLYFTLKAERLSRLGLHAEARGALRSVSGGARGRAVYRRVADAVAARAEGRSEDAIRYESLRALGRERWESTAWAARGRKRHWMELVPSREGRGFSIEVEDRRGGGASVAVLLDGELVGCFPVSSLTRIRVARPLPGPLHLLEVELLSGPWPRLGQVRLE